LNLDYTPSALMAVGLGSNQSIYAASVHRQAIIAQPVDPISFSRPGFSPSSIGSVRSVASFSQHTVEDQGAAVAVDFTPLTKGGFEAIGYSSSGFSTQRGEASDSR
jgi:hypothetical protein